MKKLMIMLVLAIAVLATGCGKAKTPAPNLDEYLATVKEQADAINTSLETEELTQDQMNEKSAELKKLWNDAMEYVLEAAKSSMAEKDYKDLMAKQDAWAAEKEAAVAEAGKEVEGGSMYALTVNSEGAKLTEARVRELYKKIK